MPPGHKYACTLAYFRVQLAAVETEVRSLGNCSKQVDTSASRLKETLGIIVRLPPVSAVGVAFEIAPNCDASDVELAPLAVKYRHESPHIKGASIAELPLFVAEHHRLFFPSTQSAGIGIEIYR